MKRVLAILLVGAPLMSCGAAAAAWHLSPSAREKALLAALFSGVPQIQAEAARGLREHPTATAALGLIAFVNRTYDPPLDTSPLRALERPERAEAERLERAFALLERLDCAFEMEGPDDLRAPRVQPAEIARCAEEALRAHEARRREARELAGRGLLTLCLLTGHDFGTHFELHPNGHSWGSLSDDRFRRSLANLNGWALTTLAPGVLAMAADPQSPDPNGIELEPDEPDANEPAEPEPNEPNG